MYCAYITRIKNLIKHPNADRLQIGECFGNAVIVSNDYSDNQLGIYFPSDGQLSFEFAEANGLLRKMDENGKNIGGYMDPDKRNVTAIKLRGERSDGLFLPLDSLQSFGEVSELREGDKFTVFNGHEICCKYIPCSNMRKNRTAENKKNKKRAKKVDIAPLFVEHVDTEQLAYNLNAFKCGDKVEITLKMHGTSQRTAYVPVLSGYKKSFWDRICNREGTPVYDWGYVSGTRRTVLKDFEGGYYGSNEFREKHSKFFEGKLNKGEEVFYEVVGFTHTGAPIMGNGNNKKLNDKAFVKQYGETTVFSYGCFPGGYSDWLSDGHGDYSLIERVPQSEIYVYRMTMTNEDGFTVEYTPDFMRYRCEQMGVKTVPVMWEGVIPARVEVETDKVVENDFGGQEILTECVEVNAGEWIKNKAEEFYDGPDPIGKTHVREGVVVRILNRPKFCAYKHKNHTFKMLSGIAIATAEESGVTDSMSDDILAEM